MSIRRILWSVACLMVLGAWSFRAHPFPNVAELMDSPQRYDGRTVYGFVEARTVGLTGDGFVIEQRGKRLHVIWEERDVPLDCLVDMKGRFEAPDRFHAEAVRFMRKRQLKIIVSVIPALLCLPFVLFSIRWDRPSRAFALKRGRRRA